MSQRHSLRAEAIVILGLYGLYETARGLAVGDTDEALQNARRVGALEQSTGLFVEGRVQDAVNALPGLIDLLDVSYLTLHLAGTLAVLLWLHQRRPAVFPLVRTTLVLASGLALVGYLAFPTAPPRLSDMGIADTISNAHVDLNTGLVSALYNPYAAVPSMHVGYALIVAASLLRYRSKRLGLFLGVLYPPFVVLVVVGTGNHFLFDAVAGAAVAVIAAAAARLLVQPPPGARIARFPERGVPTTTTHELAA